MKQISQLFILFSLIAVLNSVFSGAEIDSSIVQQSIPPLHVFDGETELRAYIPQGYRCIMNASCHMYFAYICEHPEENILWRVEDLERNSTRVFSFSRLSNTTNTVCVAYNLTPSHYRSAIWINRYKEDSVEYFVVPHLRAEYSADVLFSWNDSVLVSNSLRIENYDRYRINEFRLPNFVFFEFPCPLVSQTLLLDGEQRPYSGVVSVDIAPYSLNTTLVVRQEYSCASDPVLHVDEPTSLRLSVKDVPLVLRNLNTILPTQVDHISFYFPSTAGLKSIQSVRAAPEAVMIESVGSSTVFSLRGETLNEEFVKNLEVEIGFVYGTNWELIGRMVVLFLMVLGIATFVFWDNVMNLLRRS